MNVRFDDRQVVVTGAARGIGGSIVSAFLAAGASVLALDRSGEALADLAARVDAGDRLLVRECDLADASACRETLDGVSPDVLVHAAGGICRQAPRPFEALSEADWRAIYDANVMTAFNALQSVVPAMKRCGTGRIVTISSGAGLRPSLTGIQSYCSAKHALIGLTRQLAHELGPHGITVNSVAPGFLRTSPDYERQWQSYGEAGQQRMLEGIAMRRIGEPTDIADAVLFLSSDNASWITGQVLPVTGNPFP